jgi:F-type H+-transporting ATPase subunit delta
MKANTMLNTSMARTYAKAAFEYVLADKVSTDKNFAIWQDVLNLAAKLMQNKKVAAFMQHPAVRPDQQYQLLDEALSTSISQEQQNFLRLLAYNRRFDLLPAIALLFKQLYDEYQKIIEVNVYTVVPLTKEQQDKLCNILQQRLNKQVQLNCQLEPKLLGGLVIQAGDKVIDNSLRGKLQRLSKALC